MADQFSEDVFDAMHTIMHLYRSRLYRVLRDGSHDVTHMEHKALGFFGRHPGATQSELVLHSGRDKAQLARLIRGLREKGWLAASVDEADRRSTHLHLTPAGDAVRKSLRKQGASLSGAAVKGLSQGEREQLMSLLRRVQSNLEAEPE